MRVIILVPAIALILFAIWKFLAAEWTSTWRTRRSGASNNWQNEGYMANQDGKSWSEVDGSISAGAPPMRQMPGSGS